MGLRLARPREFDEGRAIEAAMQRFWAAGYAATSVRDLGEVMGLGQASVYNAFGDKRTLFTQCLDRYLDANMRARITRLEKTLPPREAIETFLADTPDLMILDLNLPRKDGTEVLQFLRSVNDELPILILTARDKVDDRVAVWY